MTRENSDGKSYAGSSFAAANDERGTGPSLTSQS